MGGSHVWCYLVRSWTDCGRTRNLILCCTYWWLWFSYFLHLSHGASSTAQRWSALLTDCVDIVLAECFKSVIVLIMRVIKWLRFLIVSFSLLLVIKSNILITRLSIIGTMFINEGSFCEMALSCGVRVMMCVSIAKSLKQFWIELI